MSDACTALDLPQCSGISVPQIIYSIARRILHGTLDADAWLFRWKALQKQVTRILRPAESYAFAQQILHALDHMDAAPLSHLLRVWHDAREKGFIHPLEAEWVHRLPKKDDWSSLRECKFV